MYLRGIWLVGLVAVCGSLYGFGSALEAVGAARAQLTPALQITKASEPATVLAGQPLTYTIQVFNDTTHPLQNVVIHDPLPLGVETNGPAAIQVISGVAPAIQVSPWQVTGTVAYLSPGGFVFLTIHATVSRGASELMITNGATVTAVTAEQMPYINYAAAETVVLPLPPTPIATATPTAIPTASATATPSVTPTQVATATPTQQATPTATASATTAATPTASPSPTLTATATSTALPDLADLQIDQSTLPMQFMAGALLTYTLVITNHGPGSAHDLLIQDTLPVGLHLEGPSRMSIVGGELPKLTLSQKSLTGTATLLSNGGVIRITARTRVEADFSGNALLNEASITAATPDQNHTNNLIALVTERQGRIAGREEIHYLPLVQR